MHYKYSVYLLTYLFNKQHHNLDMQTNNSESIVLLLSGAYAWTFCEIKGASDKFYRLDPVQ